MGVQVTLTAPDSFSSLIQLLEYFDSEAKAESYMQQKRWGNKPTCPHCKCDKAYRFSDGKRFKCSGCKKQFTVRIGTIFQDSKISLRKWLIAMYLHTAHKKGISSYQLSRDLRVTQKTAWFMLQRIRYMLGFDDTQSISDTVVEADETFVGGKNKSRHKDKKVPHCQGRSFKDKTPVLGLLYRGGGVRCFVVANTSRASIQPIIRNNITPGCTLISDEWGGYDGLGDAYDHRVVDHSRKQYVNEAGDTSNGIENFWSHFKRSIIGIYHKVSRKHLQGYADESAFRYNTRQMDASDRISFALSLRSQPLKYRQMIAIAA